jgi:hypothetical protein
MTTSTRPSSTSSSTETYIFQGDEEFSCSRNWGTYSLPVTDEEKISFLTEILEDEDAFEDENYENFDFQGLTPADYARQLVEKRYELEKQGITWNIEVTDTSSFISISYSL